MSLCEGCNLGLAGRRFRVLEHNRGSEKVGGLVVRGCTELVGELHTWKAKVCGRYPCQVPQVGKEVML